MKLAAQDRHIIVAFGVFLAFCILLSAVIVSQTLEPDELAPEDRLIPPSSNPIAIKSRASLEIGAYIENIYKFSPDDQTFNAEGRIWLNWPEATQAIIKNQALPPEKWLNWVNQLDGWDFKLEPISPQPIKLENGTYHQSFKFAGEFYADNMDFRRYPFQKVRLPLSFELTESLPQTGDQALTLLPDVDDSGVGGFINLIGYKTTGFSSIRSLHEYGSNMGISSSREGKSSMRLPQVSFLVSYQQSPNAALLTLLLPLTVIMAIVMLSPSLSPSLWDVRLGIPPTALLTLIFLQQSYKEKLPDLPYPTYLDLVYNVCYFVNLILFALFLWASNRLHQATEKTKSRVVASIDDLDRLFQCGLVLLMIVLIPWFWFRLPNPAF